MVSKLPDAGSVGQPRVPLRRGTLTLIGPRQRPHRVVPLLGYPGAGMGVLARQLHAMGLALGAPLVGAEAGGARGWQVHRALGEWQQTLLGQLGCAGDGLDPPAALRAAESAAAALAPAMAAEVGAFFDREFGGGVWGFADPRTAPLWSFWRRCFALLQIDIVRPIVLLRSPQACCAPPVMVQGRRGAEDIRPAVERAVAAWSSYYDRLEALMPADAVWVDFDALTDPARNRAVLARCARHIGMRSLLLEPAHALLQPRPISPEPPSPIQEAAQAAAEHHARLLRRTQVPHIRAGEALEQGAAALNVRSEPWSLAVPRPLDGRGGAACTRDRAPDCIYVVAPSSGPEAWPFAEVALTLFSAFRDLGKNVPIVHRLWEVQGTPLVLGGQLLTSAAASALPRDAIIYNLEQVSEDSRWFSAAYKECLRRHRLWDYSERNLERLRRWNIDHGQLCPIGSHPALCRLRPRREDERDIDVLFYGALNARRRRVLSELSRRGLEVTILCDVYGALRDELISRARLVLNVHFYESQILETVRLSYLMANGVCVLSEPGSEPELWAELEGGLLTADYDGLVDACEAAVADPLVRAEVAERARALMATRVQSEYLRSLLGPQPPLRERFCAG